MIRVPRCVRRRWQRELRQRALEYYDFASGKYFPILDAGTPGVGHFDSVTIDGHTLYLGDMSTIGTVNDLSGLGQGAIYEFDFSVASAPEPSTWILAGIALLLGWKAIDIRKPS